MKKILFISFFFPPTGLAGAIRVTKFVKYLPDFSIEPIVLTATEDIYGSKDYSLLNDISETITIVRVPAFYLPNLMPKFKFLKLNQIISFVNSHFFWPDSSIHWAKKAFLKAIQIIEESKEVNKIDTIITTGGPFSTHLIGLWLKKIYPDIYWISDFRDEWTTNPFVHYSFIRKYYEKKLEKKVFNYSDKIITISKSMKDIFKKLYPSSSDKIELIYNGFDEDDFKNYSVKTTKNLNSYNHEPSLKIVYTGTIYGLRNPLYFFKALSILVKEEKFKNSIEIDFIGHKSYYIKKGIKKYNLDKIVNIKDKIPHNILFSEITNYDVLLLLIGSGQKAKRIITGKVFEYLRLCKPILALGPEDSEVAMILNSTKSGVSVDFSNIEKITKMLKYLIELKKEDKLHEIFKPDKEKIDEFNRKNLTKKLADIIKKATIENLIE